MRTSCIACLVLLAAGCAYDHFGLFPGGAVGDGAIDAPPDAGGNGDDGGAVDVAIADAPVDATVDARVDAAVDAAVDASVDVACPDPDTDPICLGPPVLGDVSGDTASTPLTAGGSAEAWYQVNIVENNDTSLEAITAQIDLVSPPGVDFDLFVTCHACGDARIVSSNNGPGMTDTVVIGRSDSFGAEVDFSIFVEIRWISATACGDWSLTVTGDVDTTDRPCN